MMGVLVLAGSMALMWGARAPGGATPAVRDEVAERDESFESGLLEELREIDARAAEIKSLRAEFVQKKHTALLKKPLESSGTMVMKGEAVRWDTKRPRESVMVASGGEIRIYFPEAKVVEVYAAEGDLRELSASPIPRLETLRKNYEIRRMEQGAGGKDDSVKERAGETLAIELTPKTEALREHVLKVEVVLDRERACVRRLVITDIDDERTEIEFSDVRIDAPVKDEEMELKVPEGTRVSRPAAPGAGQGERSAPAPKATSGSGSGKS